MKFLYPYVNLIKEEGEIINIKEELIIPPVTTSINAHTSNFLIRATGTLKDKGIFLPNSCDWIIVEDEEKELILLQLRREY